MEEQRQKFNLQEYWNMFLRRKWFFIVPLIILYLSFLVSSYFLPKIYEAKATILIEEKKVVSPLLRNLAIPTTAAQRLNALREEILAWPRLFQLVEKLELNKDVHSHLELERLISTIRKNITLRMRSNEIITISYRGKDPKNTQKLVNTLCEILIQRNVVSQVEDTESAIDFINEQLAIYKKKLDESEAALRKFKEVYGLYKVPLADSLHVGASKSGNVSPENASFKIPLMQINKELGELEAELVIASVDCTDEHPRIKSLKRRIASLKEKRKQYIEKIANKVGVDPISYVDIADSFPRQQEELARLTRDKAINERIYAMLLERLESAKITERLDNSENRTKFRIIEPARLPLIPVKPNKLKLNLLGLILGGMVGFGFVYLLESTDTSFKSADELKSLFNSPVLGTISKIVTEKDLEERTNNVKKIFLVFLLIFFLTTLLVIFISKIGLNFLKYFG
ncbi:MAG: hypothetical protein DRP72_03540 [Candidatus Omnitrophota bacterium]|nr:MAG: hypothetical protein DRP72_03540 [Candidatus Omnitrophota bacterium]